MTRHSIPTIGLLGGPGSGKSLVARQLASLGCVVIDSDALAGQALRDPHIIEQIAGQWGSKVLTKQGQVDRKALGKIVFENTEALKLLEAIIHPVVHAHRAKRKQEALALPDTCAIVEDCPLLLETGIAEQCDVLVFVDAPLALRRERVARTRDWGPDELARRESLQLPLDMKRNRADYVISNDADEDHCLEQTRQVLSRIIH